LTVISTWNFVNNNTKHIFHLINMIVSWFFSPAVHDIDSRAQHYLKWRVVAPITAWPTCRRHLVKPYLTIEKYISLKRMTKQQCSTTKSTKWAWHFIFITVLPENGVRIQLSKGEYCNHTTQLTKNLVY
jgi:hypothetical protein